MRKVTALALVVAGAFPLAGCFVGSSASDEAPLAAQEQPQAPLFAADFPDPEKDVSDTELQRAVAVFRSMQRAEPSNHEANIKLGEVYLRLKQPSEAIKQFTSALSASAQEAKAKQGLGLAFLRLGDRDSARRYLTEALSADATLWRANLGLGQLADEARDWNAAEAAYQAALIPRPRAAAHNNLGLSYARQRRYDEAITQFHLALALKADPLVRTNLRFAYAMKGEYLNALAGVAKENLPDALNNVGYAAMLRGDYEAAEAYLTRAIEASATHHRTASDNLQLLNDLRNSKLARATP